MDPKINKIFKELGSEEGVEGENRLKLLIAEDDATIRDIYNDVLSNAKFEKKFAENGHETVKIFDYWNPDIILLDIEMPIMDGCKALQEIRNREIDQEEKTTVIMATSKTDKQSIMECTKFGIQGYIVKADAWEGLTEKILTYHLEYLQKLLSG